MILFRRLSIPACSLLFACCIFCDDGTADDSPGAGKEDARVEPFKSPVSPESEPLAKEMSETFQRLPPIAKHYEGITTNEVNNRLKAERAYRELQQERIENKWFAALVSTSAEERNTIRRRFASWKSLIEFLVDQEALVDVWAYPEGADGIPRRITAPELAALKKERWEQPTFITVTFRDQATGTVETYRAEFGFEAASTALAASRSYYRHREFQIDAREILGSRDARGKLSAINQWEALSNAVDEGRLSLIEMPDRPEDARDLFVAFEYEVDEFGNYAQAVRVYRESEVEKRVVSGPGNQSTEILRLKSGRDFYEATGYRRRESGDEIEPAPNPIPGRDYVELRIRNPQEPDARRWNVVEFGEPELLKESALAKFSLINAYLEKRRKELNIKKSNLDLVVEPVFTALNIAGGIVGLGVPAGEGARLVYDMTAGVKYIPRVPTVAEMRRLLGLLAAKANDPELKTKPTDLLDAADVKKLRQSMGQLTAVQVQEFLEAINDDDLKGMLVLARMEHIDAKVTTFLSILSDASAVTAVSRAGIIRAIFTNPYFSVTGEISLKNLIAVAAGGSAAVNGDGFSLRQLIEGKGPATAWLQFLNVTVDIRAVLNTFSRLAHRNLADKELKQPFPYAPRLSDLAAYEIRIFGFPLLMYYKHGLLKDDYRAYTNDFAYGLLGTRIVEHFPTRELMDEEIRAGRMFPLGYVRVPDGNGGWKETSLAVFAHQIPSGKHRGKTAMVIYGLKAYSEHSQLVEREYARFKAFETSLDQGAVIEQLIDAEDRAKIPAIEFEPRVLTGAASVTDFYSSLLAELIEYRRHLLRQSLGLPETTDDAALAADVRDKLAANGVDLKNEAGDPLLSVDNRFYSRFRYRKEVNGKWRVLEFTSIPGLADVERELTKAVEQQRIKQMRREAVSAGGQGIVLLNESRLVSGRFEIGPFCHNNSNEVFGFGVRSGAEATATILNQVNRLLFAERARFSMNHYAATLLDLDAKGDGTQKVFVTFEFPSDYRMEWLNPMTGEAEAIQYHNGQRIRSVTASRVIDYFQDEDGIELQSRIHENRGSRLQPEPGFLLGETRTLDVWFRNPVQSNLDPSLSRLRKLTVNYVTGRITCETFGLFPEAVESVEDQQITRAQFDESGRIASATAWLNGIVTNDFQRSRLEKLLSPRIGKTRFQFTPQTDGHTNNSTGDLAEHTRASPVIRHDAIKGISKILAFDPAHFGRLASESYVDQLDTGQAFGVVVDYEYQDDFHFGLVPARTVKRSAASGAELSVVTTTVFDPLHRRLTGTEVDYTGKSSLKTWDYRWENRVEDESGLKRTTFEYNIEETSVSGRTVSRNTGEELSRFKGEFDPAGGLWRNHRDVWHQPGILKRKETDIRSGFGKLAATQLNQEFEDRPVYDEDGREVAREVRQHGSNPDRFDLLIRREDDYAWLSGRRDVHVRIFVRDRPYDDFRTISDEEGRVVVDQIKEIPGLKLRTNVRFEDATERRQQVDVLQNDQTRRSSRFLPATRQADGTSILLEEVNPFWGDGFTNSYRIDDLSGRTIATDFANGDRLNVIDWYPGSSIPKISELRDRRGKLKARVERRLREGEDGGFDFDMERRFQIGPWDESGLAETTALLTGTDVALFGIVADEKIHFDLQKPYASPRYATALTSRNGFPVTVDGVQRSHVTAVINSRLATSTNLVQSGERTEPVQILDTVDLHGLFFHQVIRRTIDREGNILEEDVGSMPNLGATHYRDSLLAEAAARATTKTIFRYHYDPGVLIERNDNQGIGRVLAFTNNAGNSSSAGIVVNRDQRREMLTRIEGSRVEAQEGTAPDPRRNSPFRVVHHPRIMERNPYLPAQSNVWTGWTVSELNGAKKAFLESETVLDASGDVTAARVNKTTSSGSHGTRIAYRIPQPDAGALRDVSWSTDAKSMPLNTDGRSDFSDSDFIYFYISGLTNLELLITDDSGREFGVGGTREAGQSAPFWFVDSANIRWLPDSGMPRQGTVVSAPASLLDKQGVIAVSVHDLDRAGLNIRRLTSFKLRTSGNRSDQSSASQIFRLNSGNRFIADDESNPFQYRILNHSIGLRTLLKERKNRTEAERIAGLKVDATVEFNDHPVAFGFTHAARETYPIAVIANDADPGAPDRLYALAPDNGRFLESFKTATRHNHYVYTVASGFEVPRLEVRRPNILDDEIGAGLLAYGKENPVTVSLIKGHNIVTHALADSRNRIAANAFKLAGELIIAPDPAIRNATQILHEFNDSAARSAADLAREVDSLPMLAQVLLPTTTLPWQPSSTEPTNDLRDTPELRSFVQSKLRLAAQDGLREFPKTGLTPVTSAPRAKPYIETVKEADLILLEVKAEEYQLARDLLDFYQQKSAGGAREVHSSYDARSGAPLAYDPSGRRPLHSPRTSEAQIAIADAAFQLALATGDADAFSMGANLLNLVLTKFRPSGPEPRGIADLPALETNQLFSVTFWPRPQSYSLKSNARAYLLLCQLIRRESIVRTRISSQEWANFLDARRELEDWLRKYFLSSAEQTGVVSRGLVQVQNIDDHTTALAGERWTAAEDWLVFLEAADQLGVPREKTRQWLDHLARLHGVQVHGVWGLDWSIALFRQDAVSTELTAKFLRVARLLEQADAAAFATRNLLAVRTNETWPVVVTDANATLPLFTGQGSSVYADVNPTAPQFLPGVFNELLAAQDGRLTAAAPLTKTLRVAPSWSERADYPVFLLITGTFYLSILVVAIFWWRFRAVRHRWQAGQDASPDQAQLVSDSVMQLAEERWAKRVLGIRSPESAERTRYSNAPVEANFLMQLRAIHKLVVEWRRRENGWAANDPRLAEEANDDWLNGLDEFCSMVGIYMRWVIKSGAKDGFPQKDVLAENEDSNHIWSRLVLYFSEYRWGLLTLLNKFDRCATDHQRRDLNAQFVLLLNAMGMRQRATGFDARERFDFPENPSAMDLLIIQRPGTTLAALVNEMAMRLEIPGRHIVRFIKKYKDFKRQDNPYPIHPYLIEAAKLLPHFFLMALGALVFYNYQSVGDQPMISYLWDEVITRFVLAADFRWCGLLLLTGLALTIAARGVRVYRWEAAMISRGKSEFPLDKTLTGLFTKTSLVLPLIRPGWRWDPVRYDRMAWALRATGFFWFGILLLNFETPGFATFLLVKGLLAVLAFAECAAIVLPLAMTWLSRYLQDRTTDSRPASRIVRWLNQLNITATRPTSLLWQSLRYHFRPSVLSGDARGMFLVIATYFVLAAAFFFAGGILCQEMFPLWFTEQYRSQANWKLVGGAVIFWITMYLLRFGLFVFVTGVASWVATFPVKGTLGLLGLLYVGFVPVGRMLNLPLDWNALTRVAWPLAGISLLLMLSEERIAAWIRRLRSKSNSEPSLDDGSPATLGQTNAPNPATLGVVYMSGDDLSSRKLTPDLLMTRWMLLKNKFASDGLHLISGLLEKPDDREIEQWFSILREAEEKSDVTLWHPSQLWIEGETPRFPVESGLNITVKSTEERDRLLSAWHLRRWLVTMMSTAGHSQDTGVNLVDIALRLGREGLSARTVFYLIQNKYDDAENNRPSQSAYDRGELGQRNKLARLLEAVAPGSRAYSLQNWTPFGFKAGGLTGTDLIHEESLKLTTLLLLDRNATVHDLDALMADVQGALDDPNVVIVVPGRSTTNTRTAVGQGSQMVEEGHRSFLKGLMMLMGGNASECLGTGWGNILGNQYGPVQRALVNGTAPEMPLTSRMRRGASFALKLEGLIGFGPHAVGISEDTWAVSQATHNAIALGLRPRFLLSQSIWHKIRETWSHSEWLSSFPRWSGGYLQMMHDPIMQQLNDFGPLSVFAREMRANSGRFYLTALFTLLNILLMPLAIILDVTPFVEILIVLWNFGFVMNQILTVHGLQTYLESSGFHRVPALIGALLAGGLSTWVADLRPASPALVVLGFLVGGFGVGLGRWWSTRLRDVILFGPQLVLHALGQFVRQSLEFVVSGASPEDAKGVNMAYRCTAGPREDRPIERFNTLLNLRTVVWVVGFLSLVLNMVALSGLDLLNVLMLLPSLLFSVSALVGPFVMTPPVGNNPGFRDTIGRLLGWLGAILFYVSVSCLIGGSGAMIWIGAFLVTGLATYLLWRSGRYAGYHRKVDRLARELADLLAFDIRDASVIERLTGQILRLAVSDLTQVRTLLEREPISHENRVMILRVVDNSLTPLLRAPAMESRNLGLSGSRFRSTFVRSSVLALSILLWFFLVPVPGLFVLSAGAYRVATHLGTVLLIVSSLVALALAGSCFESPVQWPWRRKREHSAFARRAEEVFRSFQSLLRTPGRLNDQEVSSAFALFTDVQTYVDQHSDAYARRSLGLIENILGDKPPK